eukprot:3547574-Rhodomonas_salina.1
MPPLLSVEQHVRKGDRVLVLVKFCTALMPGTEILYGATRSERRRGYPPGTNAQAQGVPCLATSG